MKNLQASLIFSILFLFGFTANLNAQKLISPEELTPTFLKETFESLFIEVLETEETYISINNSYKFYLDIDEDKRFVLLNASFKLSDKATKENVRELLNIINSEVALIKAYSNDDFTSITYNYYFWTGGGFTKKSLFESANLMKAALNLCLDKDTKGIL